MTFCPQRNITKHQNFRSLNCGGLTDPIYLKIRRFAVFFSVKGKCGICFVFFWGMFGICCYLHHVLHTAVKQRCSGSQAHNGTGLSVVSLWLLSVKPPCVSQEGGPVLNCACRKSMSTMAITIADNMEVILFVFYFFCNFLKQRHNLEKGDRWKHSSQVVRGRSVTSNHQELHYHSQ